MNQPVTKRVKVLETEYDDKRDMVYMKLEDINKPSDDQFRHFTIAWLSDDLGQALGINQKIPPDAMQYFLQEIIGKEINLQVNSDTTETELDQMTSLGKENLSKAHSTIDKYPFYEVQERLNEQEQTSD